jgi:uncharacterized protein with GYD domain
MRLSWSQIYLLEILDKNKGIRYGDTTANRRAVISARRKPMATFIMCGKYSLDAVKKISADRTSKTMELIKKHKGSVKGMYAMLGEKDLLFILELPSVAAAMQVSVALSKMTGIAFSTAPAVTVEEFDKLMA